MCVRLNRTSRSTSCTATCRPGLARALSTAIDLIRTAFFLTAPILIWRYIGIISGEEMTTIRVPKNLFYGFVFLGFV
jgi:TRAP-type C4-dicarboxylate transport system permease small subunit